MFEFHKMSVGKDILLQSAQYLFLYVIPVVISVTGGRDILSISQRDFSLIDPTYSKLWKVVIQDITIG